MKLLLLALMTFTPSAMIIIFTTNTPIILLLLLYYKCYQISDVIVTLTVIKVLLKIFIGATIAYCSLYFLFFADANMQTCRMQKEKLTKT